MSVAVEGHDDEGSLKRGGVGRQFSDFSALSSPLKIMKKAKRIRFLCNGDKFCKGVVIPVTHERYRFISCCFKLVCCLVGRNFIAAIKLPKF